MVLRRDPSERTLGVRALRCLAAGALLLAPALLGPQAQATTSRQAIHPSTFGFGLQASTDTKGLGGWMPRSGAAWDYAYRYLGGGTGNGAKNWTAWEANATYPISYARVAASKGYTPVFTYYQLLASSKPCGTCGEAQRDLAGLNSGPLMKAYFSDFATLMKRLGSGTHDGVAGFGGDALVHVEPDLSGYAEMAVLSKRHCFSFCTATGNSPANLRSAVASSGFPLAASYPNTYQGFNQVLLRLRDTYAPNVRLATHLSNWATGFDLNSATAPHLDPLALGAKAGAFLAASGAGWTNGTHSPYDLVFNDVSNKDAGYYTHVLKKPRFWDQDNTVFPNFHRWQDYVRAATTATGRKAIVWQVPIGNQRYASMNNTPGHYQDNRVEYFFDHVSELAGANIIGVLFGTTIRQATNYADWAGDGVTNPAPICSSDGWSSGKVVCSSTQTPAADDDGGYLRVRARDYYRVPFTLR
ncbi:MAG: hypothetical protein JWN87_285 [Frankiales bacterium]|nr:hypothetical protein [Frankiales bacterium]